MPQICKSLLISNYIYKHLCLCEITTTQSATLSNHIRKKNSIEILLMTMIK